MSLRGLLAIRGLRKRFGGIIAVNGVDLDVAAGEILGLIGPNGSGKSTTLYAVMGIVAPDGGTVHLNGTDITAWPTHRVVKSGVGFVFQHSRPLHRQSVLEHIELALLPDSVLRALGSSHLRERARSIARRVGLEGALDLLPGALPYAHLRRLELAKAIARDPHLLLLDEPFAGLTSAEIAEFAQTIRALREGERGIVLVDHSVKAVFSVAERIAALHLGRKIAEGPPRDVLDDRSVREVYFGGSLDGRLSHAAARAFGEATELPASPAPVLEVRGVSVWYDKAQALHDVSLEVRRGEFVSVVGLNGAGKSTLVKAIMGFVPCRGEIRWNGVRRVEA